MSGALDLTATQIRSDRAKKHWGPLPTIVPPRYPKKATQRPATAPVTAQANKPSTQHRAQQRMHLHVTGHPVVFAKEGWMMMESLKRVGQTTECSGMPFENSS